MIENDIKAPLIINPTPQTQSWFVRKFKSSAEGIPKINPKEATIIIALPLLKPKSINVLVVNSTIDIKEVVAAKNKAIKNIDAKITLTI